MIYCKICICNLCSLCELFWYEILRIFCFETIWYKYYSWIVFVFPHGLKKNASLDSFCFGDIVKKINFKLNIIFFLWVVTSVNNKYWHTKIMDVCVHFLGKKCWKWNYMSFFYMYASKILFFSSIPFSNKIYFFKSLMLSNSYR